jgi:hypothetical protein
MSHPDSPYPAVWYCPAQGQAPVFPGDVGTGTRDQSVPRPLGYALRRQLTVVRHPSDAERHRHTEQKSLLRGPSTTLVAFVLLALAGGLDRSAMVVHVHAAIAVRH